MRFKVIDNNGKEVTTKNYVWDREGGIPNEDKVLEDLEECTCNLNESDPYCDGSCFRFDEGKVLYCLDNQQVE